MKKILLLLTTVLFFYSCRDNGNKPNPFIEEDKMESILYDVAILYGMQSTYGSSADSIKQINIKSIFKKYDIDSITFVANNRYYIGLDDLIYFKMQNRIMKRLEKERSIVDTLLSKSNKVKVEQLIEVKQMTKRFEEAIDTTKSN